MRRTKQEAALTRQAILRSSLAVFSTRSYSGARLDDVARLAGVTRGAVYWHFGSKAGLFEALLEGSSTRVSEVVLGAFREDGNFTEVVGAAFQRLLTMVEQDRGLQAVMELALLKTEDSPELRTVRRRQLEAADTLVQALAEIMRQAATRMQIRPDISPEAAARGMLALQQGIIQQWLLHPRAFSLGDISAAAAGIFLEGVRRK